MARALNQGDIVEIDGVQIEMGAATAEVDVRPAARDKTRAAARRDPMLEVALARGGRVGQEIELENVRPARAPRGARTGAAKPMITITLPRARTRQVLYVTRADGVVEWLFPEVVAPTKTSARAGASRDRFVVPVEPRPKAPPGAAKRGLAGALLKKVLRVLIFPLFEPVIGAAAQTIAATWEAAKRPDRLRDFTQATYAVVATKDLDVNALAKKTPSGPVLVFVHGTFSTTHGCFGRLDPAVVGDLARRYRGCVVAFDHPTLSVHPDVNAATLARLLGPDLLSREIDVVAHSRGGLVARALARLVQQQAGSGRVRTLVHVGVPNAGTPLVDTPYMKRFIDSYTNLFVALPAATGLEIADGIFTAVEEIAAAAAAGLVGLQAMNPRGDYLKTLSAAQSTADTYAVASDFDAVSTKSLAAYAAALAADAVVTAAFKGANDLVVPNASTFAAVPAAHQRLLEAGRSVIHTAYFGSADVGRALQEWLPGAGGG